MAAQTGSEEPELFAPETPDYIPRTRNVVEPPVKPRRRVAKVLPQPDPATRRPEKPWVPARGTGPNRPATRGEIPLLVRAPAPPQPPRSAFPEEPDRDFLGALVAYAENILMPNRDFASREAQARQVRIFWTQVSGRHYGWDGSEWHEGLRVRLFDELLPVIEK